jgi:hypothetical protein
LSANGGKISSADSGGGDLPLDDVELADGSVEWTKHFLVRVNGRVDRGEDREGSCSSEFGGDAAGLETFDELVEVVVSLQLTFLLADGDTLSTPDLSRSLEALEGVDDGATATDSSRSCDGSNRSGGWSWSGLGGSSDHLGRAGATRTHLQVLLETWCLTDTLTRVLVFQSIRVSGISHTSGTELWPIEQDSGEGFLLSWGESGGASYKSGKENKFGLQYAKRQNVWLVRSQPVFQEATGTGSTYSKHDGVRNDKTNQRSRKILEDLKIMARCCSWGVEIKRQPRRSLRFSSRGSETTRLIFFFLKTYYVLVLSVGK